MTQSKACDSRACVKAFMRRNLQQINVRLCYLMVNNNLVLLTICQIFSCMENGHFAYIF